VTRPPLRTWLAIIGIAVIAAAIVTLVSGSWAPRVGAMPAVATRSQPSGAPESVLATSEGAVGSVLLGGYATWYATPGLTAAAGPELRGALGDWRGQWVTVESGRQSVTVQITDWCACGERHGIPTLLDLSDAAFQELAPLSTGVVRVSIEIDPPEHPDDARMRLEDRQLPATDVR
jgi:hypothetical protein